MKFGFIPIEGPRYAKEAVEEVVYGEELGFSSAFIQERHLVKDCYWPSPLSIAAQFLARTSRIKIGTAVMILPFYHPARVAEEISTLDNLSGGRFIAGLALGYKADEFLLYGISMKDRGARFEEAMAIVKELLAKGRGKFEGKYFSLECADFEPKPFTKPYPSLWVGGWGPLMLKRAAVFGDAWFPGVSANLTQLLERKKVFLRHRQAAGLELPSEWPLIRDVVIAETSSQAHDLAKNFLHPFYHKVYAGGWKHQFIPEDIASDFDRLKEERFIIGDPDEVIAGIKHFEEKYGANNLICRFSFGDMPHENIMRELKLFSKFILPAWHKSGDDK